VRDELPDEIHHQIQDICRKGDALAGRGEFREARKTYWTAFDLVPEPREDWNATTWILAAIGDSFFLERDFKHGVDAFSDAVRCAGGLGNVFIHLRMGECYFELGDEKRAADNLTRAYMGGGREVFAKEDPKYFRLLERVLKPPAGQGRL
jgi:hypothetical protein